MSRFLRQLVLLVSMVAIPGIQGEPVAGEPSASPKESPSLLPGETVVLLHGLGLGSWAMKRFEYELRREGYRVVNVSYDSRRLPLEELAGVWLPRLLHETGADAAPRLHFVTHSMGGIIVRLWLRQPAARISASPAAAAASPSDPPAPLAPGQLGQVIMLAPPNTGSEVPDRLRKFPPFRWFTGLNGVRLGTGPNSLPRALGPWPATAGRLGIIAGNRSLNPLFSSWIPGPDDGKVAVASAPLDGMSDFLVVPHSHTWIQWRRTTIRQTLAFLRHARFEARE